MKMKRRRALRGAPILAGLWLLTAAACSDEGVAPHEDSAVSKDRGLEAAAPEAGKPEAGKPDAATPDTGKTDAPAPDAAQKDQAVPDKAQKDQAAPDQAAPDQAAPDKAAPVPDQAAPDKALPDKAVPDLLPPDQTVPDTLTPDLAPDLYAPGCGDGFITGLEQCDGVKLGTSTCKTLGYKGGTLKCDPKKCVFDTSGCHHCGNKVLDAKEDCDGTLFKATSCKGLLYQGGTLTCKSNCTYDKGGCWTLQESSNVPLTYHALGDQVSPAIACTVGSCLVVYSSAGKLKGLRVDKAAKIIGKEFAIAPPGTGAQAAPAVVLDGAHYFVVWQDSRASVPHIRGAKLTTSGAIVLSDVLISNSANGQYTPALACDGSNCLVTWRDGYQAYGSTGSRSVQGSLVAKNGIVKTPAGTVYAGPWSYHKVLISPTSVASSGSNYLVTYSVSANTHPFYARVVDTSGKAGASITLMTANGPSDSDVIWDGANYSIAYSGGSAISSSTSVMRVSSAGVMVGSKNVATANGGGLIPATSISNGVSLVVWKQFRKYNSNTFQGILVRAGLPASGVIQITGNGNTIYDYTGPPAVSHDGTQHVLVWAQKVNNTVGYDIFLRRIKTN